MFKLTDLRDCIYFVPKQDDDTDVAQVVFEIRTAANRETKAGGPLWRKAYKDPELTQEVAVRTDQIYLIEEVKND